MTRSSLRRQFEEPPKPPKKYDAEKEEKEFKSAWLYGNIVLCLVVVFMCVASLNWMNADLTGEYVAMVPEKTINEKNSPTNRYWQNTETDPQEWAKRQRVIDSLRQIKDRQGGTDDNIRLSITRGPLTMYGDLTIDGVRLNLISTDAPHTDALDLVFETSEYDMKYYHFPKRRCVLRGVMKDGIISGTMQLGNQTHKIQFQRNAMASLQRRVERSPLFGHWKWPWEQSS